MQEHFPQTPCVHFFLLGQWFFLWMCNSLTQGVFTNKKSWIMGNILIELLSGGFWTSCHLSEHKAFTLGMENWGGCMQVRSLGSLSCGNFASFSSRKEKQCSESSSLLGLLQSLCEVSRNQSVWECEKYEYVSCQLKETNCTLPVVMTFTNLATLLPLPCLLFFCFQVHISPETLCMWLPVPGLWNSSGSAEDSCAGNHSPVSEWAIGIHCACQVH